MVDGTQEVSYSREAMVGHNPQAFAPDILLQPHGEGSVEYQVKGVEGRRL